MIRVQHAISTSNCDGCDKSTQTVKVSAVCGGSNRSMFLCRKCRRELIDALRAVA